MPTTPEPSRRRRRAGVRCAIAALLLTLATGCGGDADPPVAPSSSVPAPVDDATPDASGTPVPGEAQGGLALGAARELAPALDRVLQRRAAALVARDRTAFAGTVDLDDEQLVLDQGTYFDNLAQLPVASLELEVSPSSLLRVGEGYWGVVQQRLELDGFDDGPVVSQDRYLFVPRPGAESADRAAAGRPPRSFVVASVEDPAWEEAHDVRPQPWDLGAIEVRTRPGVLGVFDADSVAAAGPLMASAVQAVTDVSGVVPYPWSGSVVLVALGDPAFLEGIDPPLGGLPERLDGLAYTEPGAEPGAVASTRIALHPRMLARPGAARDRLVRHELTHVALGGRDDDVPVWLSEGLAEWVSVQPLAPEERRVARPALRAARERAVVDLPDDATFGEEDVVAYATSWWAVEFLASSFGEAGLWALLDQVGAAAAAAPEGEGREAAAAAVESLTGFDDPALARQAARLIRVTYAAPTPSTETPAPSRGAPGA